MSTPISAILTGTFDSDGGVQDISLPPGYTKFELINLTDIGSAAANTNVMRAIGTSEMADGSGLFAPKTSGATTIALWDTTLVDGFTFVEDSGNVLLGAANSTISAIDNTLTTQVTLTSTEGLADFDVVRLFDTTGMLQIAGWDFTIDNTVTNTSFDLKFIDASSFAAPASAGTLRRVPFDPRFYPVNRRITGVGNFLPSGTFISMSVTHGFTVGQLVRIKIPEEYGMIELDGTLATIVGLDSVLNSILIEVDSSSFTPFKFPTSAEAAAGVEVPQVIPVGQGSIPIITNSLGDATTNLSFRGIQIGTKVHTAGSRYQWIATRGVDIVTPIP